MKRYVINLTTKMSADSQILNALTKFSNQKYDRIKSECLKQEKLFVDDLFLPNDKSLFKRVNKLNGIVWKRPHVRLFLIFGAVI